MDLRPIRTALISVSDKTGLVRLARVLLDQGIQLISTGGTFKNLREAGLEVKDVSSITRFPEMMDGRIKTLHPMVHGGILAIRDNPAHQQALQEQGISPIDLVICNLYPFAATVARKDATAEEIIENIDIGGPTMVRSAAKNFHDVAIVTSPKQYLQIEEEIVRNSGKLSLTTRRSLAAFAFAQIAEYDRAISNWFNQDPSTPFPPIYSPQYERKYTLRYGENPHQKAAFYIDPQFHSPGLANSRVLHGKELSFNNLQDLESALALVREFAPPAAVVIKHNNPCGAAIGSTLVEVFQKAYEGDPQSAFGGILAFNRPVDQETAHQITEPQRFIECIIAPDFTPEAFELLTTRPSWKKSVRLLATGPLTGNGSSLTIREIEGGLLVQDRDATSVDDDFKQARVVTQRQPTTQELSDLRFAWSVCKHVKSNAIVLARDGQVVGVGAGQMSRVDSVHMATRKAGTRSQGSVLASDAFFPFRDNVDLAAEAGVTAIVQPGGSVRDIDSIAACDELLLTMIFTGVRHFKH